MVIIIIVDGIIYFIIWSNYSFTYKMYGESNFKHILIKTCITPCLNLYHCKFDQHHREFEREAICCVAKYEEQCQQQVAMPSMLTSMPLLMVEYFGQNLRVTGGGHQWSTLCCHVSILTSIHIWPKSNSYCWCYYWPYSYTSKSTDYYR